VHADLAAEGEVSHVRSGTSLPRTRADRLPERETRRGSGKEFRALAHTVQSYHDDRFLCDTVARFVASGLESGDQVVVIATEAHRQGLMQRLEVWGVPTTDRERLILLDARDTLSKFMVDDMPDATLFRAWVAPLIAGIIDDNRESRRLRAFSETVDLLWKDGNSRAAIRREELWNEAQETNSFSLLCAYIMANLYGEEGRTTFLDGCATQPHTVRTSKFDGLEDSASRMGDVSRLRQHALRLEAEVRQRKELEMALRSALADRDRVQEELRLAVEREKEARAQAEMSDRCKEMFIAMLGHDLRNPLNTILTTTRLMAMRGELCGESKKRLERVVGSGERMERMIEQVLDLTSASLGGGIVIRKRRQDLVPLATKIVNDVRGGRAAATEFWTDGSCEACVDEDRFEQVVSNLLDNAVKHGDPQTPIRVALMETGATVSLTVQNYGPPIDPSFMPLLFDPIKPGKRRRSRSDGVGLGLYISERIVAAHGGKIEVHSTLLGGTRASASFPKND
jgi:signal transduction histidine kinase